MNKYIGITIGPIYDTLISVTKPAGLWGGSFLFSYIAKNICLKMHEKEIKECNIVSPFFVVKDGKIDTPKNGIGLFHDRIIFKSNDGDLKIVEEIIDDVKREVSEGLGFDDKKVKEFVNNYLQIYAVEKEVSDDKNPILVLSPYLDALELQKSYNLKEKFNYFLNIFENDSVKTCFLINDFDNFKNSPIAYGDNTSIKKIDDIAKGDNDGECMKKHSYYAIVKADGDNMGKILNSISEPKDIKEFSKACFEFGKSSTDKLKEFGATTIYAGGDDLLFISPLENKNKISLFDLLLNIEQSFKDNFEIDKYKKYKPSLSFGVSINYRKFPLYEAFDNANNLLFGVAKQEDEKNTTAITLQKHSGKSVSLIITKTKSNETYKFIRDLLKSYNEDSNDFLKSIRLKLYEFKTLFQKAIVENDENKREILLNNLFNNIFDHEVHQIDKNKEYKEKIRELLIKISKDKSIKVLKDEEEAEISTMDSVLRILNFFTEKGEEGKE